MSRRCAVYYCKSKRGVEARDIGISFHRFPKEKTILNEWIRLCRIENYGLANPSYYTLCSEHFTPECFTFTEKRRTIKEAAIPSKFNFPSKEEYSTMESSRRNSIFKRRGRPPKIRVPQSSGQVPDSNTFTPPSSPEDGRLMIDLSSPLPDNAQWVSELKSSTSSESAASSAAAAGGIPATRYTSTPEMVDIASPHHSYGSQNEPCTPLMPPPPSPMPSNTHKPYGSPVNYNTNSGQYQSSCMEVPNNAENPINALQKMQAVQIQNNAENPIIALQAMQAVQSSQEQNPNTASARSSCMVEENTNRQSVEPRIENVYSLNLGATRACSQTQRRCAESFEGFETVYLEQMLMGEPAEQEHIITKVERVTPPPTTAIDMPLPVYAPQPVQPPLPPPPLLRIKENLEDFSEIDMNNPTHAVRYFHVSRRYITDVLIKKKQLEIKLSRRDDKLFKCEAESAGYKSKVWQLEQFIKNREHGAATATHQPCNIPNCLCRSSVQQLQSQIGKRKYERKVPAVKKQKTSENTNRSNSQTASYPKPGSITSPVSIPSPMIPGQNSPVIPTLPNFSELTSKTNMVDYSNQNMYNPNFHYGQNQNAYYEYIRRVQSYQAQHLYAQNYALQAHNMSAQNLAAQNLLAQNMRVQNLSAQNLSPHNLSTENLSNQNVSAPTLPSQNFTAQNLATSSSSEGYQNYPQYSSANNYYPYNNTLTSGANVQQTPENWSNNTTD